MGVPTHSFRRQWAICKIPQTNYNTPTASGVGGANYKKQIMRTKDASVDETPNVQNNRSQATGQRQATKSWIVSHDNSAPFDFDLCSEEIGRWLLLTFGKVVTTTLQAPLVGPPAVIGVYQHVFSCMNLTLGAQIPVTGVVEQCGPALDTLYPSCAVQSLSIKGEGTDRLGVSGNAMGSGKTIEPSAITIAEQSGVHYLGNSQVTLTLDDGSTVTNAADAPQRLNSWESGVNNTLALEDGFRPGSATFQDDDDPESGEVRSECLLVDQDYVMRFNLRLLTDSTFFAALRAQTPFTALFDILGAPIDETYNHELKINGQRVVFKRIGKPVRNGLVTADIETDVQWDTTAGKDLTMTLINTVPSYTS
jgi:hypothetical protein